MKIRKVNQLIHDSAEKQVLENASILIDQINQSMENNEIEDDFINLADCINEIINKARIGD